MAALSRTDALFFLGAALAWVLALASGIGAAALVHRLDPARARLVRLALLAELIMLVAAPAMAWAGVSQIAERFGASEMTALLAAPAARAGAVLAAALIAANGALIAISRREEIR